MNLFGSTGCLRYSLTNSGGYSLKVMVDQQIADYYFSLIPKCIYRNRQMYPAHISTVRNEVPPYLNVWGKHEGKEVEFFYSNEIEHGTVYWWLNVFSKQLEEIRLELGLNVLSLYTKPPEGWNKTFHLTLANCKGQ